MQKLVKKTLIQFDSINSADKIFKLIDCIKEILAGVERIDALIYDMILLKKFNNYTDL